MEGGDLAPLLRGEDVAWRDWLLYEYYWERNFPQTPTVHAIRENRYKYIHFHGVWDIDELYDLQDDPLESNNLIFSPGHEAIAERLNAKLFDALEATGGLQIPLPRDAGERNVLRDANGPGLAPFPEDLLKWLAR
jgi:N-acetylglucosamine-6-sulfatase